MRCIEQCGAMKTYPKVWLHLHRHVLSLRIGGVGIVVKGVGQLPLPGIVNQAREVGLAQKDLECH
jgi:hypothetical protein